MTRPAASHVWINGELRPSDAAHLSVYDRGFQLGDGVFEALRARCGVAIELAGHLTRLHGSLGQLAIELTFGDDEIAERLLANNALLRLPLVRFGNAFTAGPAEATWKSWLASPK